MARIGETRHFIAGEGYVFYGTDHVDVGGGYLEGRPGWYLEATPDGNPGATFRRKFIGANRDEVRARRPDIAHEMRRLGVRGW